VRQGVSQARAVHLCGCPRSFLESPWPEVSRDIDILFVGDLHPAARRGRLPWLGRLARLGNRWRVVIRPPADGDAYRELLARARIVFHHGITGADGIAAVEAAAAGALVFLEPNHPVLSDCFRDRQECVSYRADDLETLLEQYLGHEDQRRAIAEAGRE